MLEVIQHMLDSLENPAMKHAAVVHLPIGLAMVAVPFAFLSALISKSKAMRWTALGLYVALAGTAWLATQTGEDASDLMTQLQPSEAFDVIEEHEEMAQKVWIFALVTAGLFALSAFPAPIMRRGGAWLGVVAALATGGWVAATGHFGGTGVYEYAIGTANPVTIAQPAQQRSPQVGEDRETAGEESGDASQSGAGVEAGFDLTALNEREVFFVTNVLPIMQNSCQRCHNPRRAGRSGKLDQTSMESILFGGRSGPALVPGNPEQSLIYQRITSDDDDVRMPPKEPLSAEEQESIRKWIADGAVWVTGN